MPDRATRSISTFVSNLRGVLGDVIVRDGDGYLLRIGRERVDATAFTEGVAAAQREASEGHIWQYLILEAVALDDQALYAESIEAGRRAREKTGGDADFWVRVRAASYEQRHSDVLALYREWADEVRTDVDRDGARHLEEALHSEPWRESPFFVMLLPIAIALEATGRVADAHRIAREAPALMAQDKFPHDGPIGEAPKWAELLARLGGGEPEGLKLEEGFAMVHDMLIAAQSAVTRPRTDRADTAGIPRR